jgi:superfamily II DNA or RNA helicase
VSDEVTARYKVALIGCRMSSREEAGYRALTKRIGGLAQTLVEVHGFPDANFGRFLAKVKEAADSDWSPARAPSREFLTCLAQRKDLMATSRSKLSMLVSLTGCVKEAGRTLVFTETIDMAQDAADVLAGAGIKVGVVHSELDAPERRRVLLDLKRGQLSALVAPRVLDEGVDVPEADLAIIVAASRTRRQMIQRMGRVLRRKSDRRLARFAILYLDDTIEDPERGGHEGFLGEVVPFAETQRHFPAGVPSSDLTTFLNDFRRLRPVLPPVYLGNDPRPIERSRAAHAGPDVWQFLGIKAS